MRKKMSMKQISLIVSICVFTILFIAVLIILTFTKKSVNRDVLKDRNYVGLIMNGSKDDRSWSMSHYSALTDVSGKLNFELICRDNTPADDSCEEVIRSLVEDEKCLVVIATSIGFEPYMEKAAAEYPYAYFLQATGTAAGNNLGSFMGRMYQMRYLSGIVAGVQTKTNSIGYVAALPISSVNRGINAFTLGVRSVNPDAVVHVSFCNTWTDDALAAASAEKLINEYGADVITLHTDSLAPLDTADKLGVWSIGYSYDNSDRYPDSMLTSCVWRWENYYRTQILSCIQHKFRGEHSWLGIESGLMELIDPAKAGNAAAGYEKPLKTARNGFEKYINDVFYGPVTDNEGNVRVGEGESLSDENMLKNFDWYVEGVEIEP